MDEETKLEKEFSENVDKMLAGQSAEIDATQGEDYQATLDFVHKLIELRSAPRPSFEAKLKASLLSKLSESEQETKSSFWKGWLNMVTANMNKSIWRAVTPVVLVVILAVGVMWGTGVLPGLIGDEVPAPGPHPTPAPQ